MTSPTLGNTEVISTPSMSSHVLLLPPPSDQERLCDLFLRLRLLGCDLLIPLRVSVFFLSGIVDVLCKPNELVVLLFYVRDFNLLSSLLLKNLPISIFFFNIGEKVGYSYSSQKVVSSLHKNKIYDPVYHVYASAFLSPPRRPPTGSELI